ncbi:beta-lactamase family protein [Corallococcus sp. M34]|uniref:serine hydrolase domain-containing protein n=1 Tax=Citreicoccus inhibens TaxID=2849499 RepID=UPI001C21D4BE|nr:serine hydrolase domain-containing protein [Citreicoccus inhibens]MBU8896736.1 beta-lactamase family protein [Citreicoccus inhibens]
MRGCLVAVLLLVGRVAGSAQESAAPRVETPAAPPASAVTEFPPETQRVFEAIVRTDLEEGPMAGLSVGVMQGTRHWSRGFGYRDLGRKLPATARTTYRMASITKSFTAVAVLQLVEQGKLDLDADIRTLVPDYPVKQWPVTVRQLLGHLSGVPSYDSPKAGENTRPVTTREAIAMFSQKPLVFEPGTRYLYSTWGFNLLGAAVETASGQSYRDYLRAHVFGPAGMVHADLDEMRTRDEHQAVGYRVVGSTLKPSHFLDVTSRFGGGGTRATVDDLLGFARAVLDDRLVSRATMGRMQTSMATKDGHLTDYGMGLATYPFRGHYVVAHAGGQPETTTLLIILPAEDTAIALATNVENEAKRLRRLSIRLMEQVVDGGEARRDVHFNDPVDGVVYSGMGRLATYGLAYDAWVTRGPGTLPPDPNLAGAFARVSTLLDRNVIAREPAAALSRIQAAHEPRGDSVFIRVGTRMARTVAQAFGPERLNDYRALGALAFFADYLAACEKVSCPESERFRDPLRADIQRFLASWKRADVPALRRTHLDEIKDPEPFWPVLKEAVSKAPEVHADYSEEMVHVAERTPAKDAETRLRWMSRAVELHPKSTEARLTLGQELLAAREEEEGMAHVREAATTPEGTLMLTPSGFLKKAKMAKGTRIARGLLRVGVRLHPSAPELWEALAKKERALGDASAAKAALQQARAARATQKALGVTGAAAGDPMELGTVPSP